MVEVAQFPFTPAAGAVLADWGADVVKVEHAVTGDAQRGLRLGTGGAAAGSFQPLMEHPNRGKRSIGLALETPEGYAVLMDLLRDADVFPINFLPDARRRLHLEVEDARAANLKTMEGQWAPIQDPLEVAADPQMEANEYIVPVTDLEGNERRLVANPVQFDEAPPTLQRAPQFAEHTDQILRELGKSEDEIIELKLAGAVT